MYCERQEQAEAIVAAVKYPSRAWPAGIRGTGAMFASANFNQSSRDYLLSANENVMICVQIETRKGVLNVEEIASVEGIGMNPLETRFRCVELIVPADMLFIGPNDLAASMGYVGFDHASIPEVQEAIDRVLQFTLAAGKYAGHFALSADIGMTP